MNNTEAKLEYGKIVARCWEDIDFKARFIESPAIVLKEFDIPVDEKLTYKVIESPKLVEYLVIPFNEAHVALQILNRLLLEKADANKTVIPEGVEVRLIQNTANVVYVILPFSPELLTTAELRTYNVGVKRGVTAATTNVVGVAEVVAIAVEAQTVATTLDVAAEVTVVAVGVIVLI